jgi:poly(3-hydroxybutyrate) depolymerase
MRVEEDPPGAVSIYSWTNCQQGATVKLIRMAGIGHWYPRNNNPIDTPEELWKFLKQYRLQP